jgi:hypothetical protein
VKLHFRCPATNIDFESNDFKLTENRGITIDSEGHKVLDATVTVSVCPYCNKEHHYQVSELACPWSQNVREQTNG